MFKFWQISSPFYSPEDVLDTNVELEDKPNTEVEEEETDRGILDSEDDENPDEKDSKEAEEEEDTEIPEEYTDDEEELVRVPYNELKDALKDNPKLLKSLKSAFFREQEFTKIFPTIEEAQQAVDAQQNYDAVRELVLSGDAKNFLEQVKNADEDAVLKFADSFLPALQQLDEKAYISVTRPIIKDILYQSLQYGKKHGKENVQNAAKLLNYLIFDEEDLGKPETKTSRTSTEEDEFKKKQEEFYSKAGQRMINEVAEDLDKELVSAIGEIDPGNLLKDKPKLKARIMNDIKDAIRESLQKDPAHMERMRGLWEREKRNGYSGQLKDSIKTAFLSRAKSLIPKIRKEIRAEYLGSVKEKDTQLVDKVNGLKNSKHLEAGGGHSRNRGANLTLKDVREKNMSDKDILAS